MPKTLRALKCYDEDTPRLDTPGIRRDLERVLLFVAMSQLTDTSQMGTQSTWKRLFRFGVPIMLDVKPWNDIVLVLTHIVGAGGKYHGSVQRVQSQVNPSQN